MLIEKVTTNVKRTVLLSFLVQFTNYLLEKKNDEQVETPDDPSNFRENVTANIPSGRYGTNEEMANLALFLGSDESSYCNGGIYLADGGFTAA